MESNLLGIGCEYNRAETTISYFTLIFFYPKVDSNKHFFLLENSKQTRIILHWIMKVKKKKIDINLINNAIITVKEKKLIF